MNVCDPDEIVRSAGSTLNRYHLVSEGDRVLIGLSGGVDSVVLLHVMMQLCPNWGGRVGAAHLNHGLRGSAADDDARFAAGVASQLGIPFYMGRADVNAAARERGLSIEEASRQARYTFLSETATREGYQKIAVAHHADDNAETVLLHLLRGGGLSGLSGMSPLREDGVIRPLIRVRRKQIEAFAAVRGLAFCEDETNRDCRWLRNRIRHQLMPLLAADFNPSIVASLNRMAAVIDGDNDCLSRQVAALVRDEMTRDGNHRAVFHRHALSAHHPALVRRLLREGIAAVKGDLRGVGGSHIEALMDLLAKTDTRLRHIDLPGQVRAALDSETLSFTRQDRNLRDMPPETPRESFSYLLPDPGDSRIRVPVPEAGIVIACYRESRACAEAGHAGNRIALDPDNLSFPLLIRNVQPGDRFSPSGMGGKHQKVSRFLVNRKIPSTRRGRVALLVSGETILWVIGLRASAAAALPTPSKKRVIAEVLLA